MSDLTLYQQLGLIVFDKVALGAVVGFGGYLLSRSLESYKASQSMRAEAAKIRIAKLAVLWERFEVLHSAILEIQLRIFGISSEERRKLSSDELTALGSDKLPAEAQERVQEELGPRYSQLQSEFRELRTMLEAGRFWMGKKLETVHNEQLNHLGKLLELVWEPARKGTSSSIGEHWVVGHGLESSKQDITTILRKL